MVAFAQSWSKHWRVGAPWLFKSACGDARRNEEIERQRLDPADVVELDQPNVAYEEREVAEAAAKAAVAGHGGAAPAAPGDDRLYAACIETRRDFHVDPYGGMSFCGFVKDPALRYDLRRGGGSVAPGAVQTAWDEFIPSLADTVRGGREYLEGCAACESRDDCRWCDVYGYLEHGRHGARVEHLCAVARENRAAKDRWVRDHRRHYEIAGITVQVESDLPFADATFDVQVRRLRRGRTRRRHGGHAPPLRAARHGRRGSVGKRCTATRPGRSRVRGAVGLRGHRARRRRPDAAPRGGVQRRPHARRAVQPRGEREGLARGRAGLAHHVPQRPDLAGAPAGRPRRLLPALGRHAHRRARVPLRGPLRRRQVDDHGAGARRARRARRDPLRRPQHRAPLAAGLRRRPARLLRPRHLEPRRRAGRLGGRGAAARHPLSGAVGGATRSCR